jgi:hypothetical protein
MVSSAKMISTTKLAKGPCTSCWVTAMEATIRYPDGKEANVDTGAWLHHIALFGSGTGGGSIWAAGNERPTLRLNEQEKYGIAFPTAFMLMIDLMSEDTKAKNLTLEITYENIPKTSSQYSAYKGATMYWLTIGEPAAKQGVYSFNTLPMTSSSNGKLLYAIGHMHDGGDNMSLYVGGKLVCKSIMHYNAREGYIPGAGSPMAGHGHRRRDGGPHKDGMEHISDPGACTDFGSVRTGDRLTATANYDAKKHPLMTHNGKAERLMGVSAFLSMSMSIPLRFQSAMLLTLRIEHESLCWSFVNDFACNFGGQRGLGFGQTGPIPVINTNIILILGDCAHITSYCSNPYSPFRKQFSAADLQIGLPNRTKHMGIGIGISISCEARARGRAAVLTNSVWMSELKYLHPPPDPRDDASLRCPTRQCKLLVVVLRPRST